VSDDPTDAAIEETLRAAPADRWQGLWEAVDALLAEDERAVWAGGELVETTVVGGVERPVFQMPYVTYSDAVNRVVQSLYDLDAVVPLNWPEWDGVDRYRGHRALEHASVANAVRMIDGDRPCRPVLRGDDRGDARRRDAPGRTAPPAPLVPPNQ
jgi:hypothetical protein